MKENPGKPEKTSHVHSFYLHDSLFNFLKLRAKFERRTVSCFVANLLDDWRTGKLKGDPNAVPDHNGNVRLVLECNDLPTKYTATSAPG